ncbi:hypothetical protein BKA65DRAFT_529799 [Rhexocercosporidium sp. MPI-PUGE-AT-0058]|nr:hypothetical protein BKA65DRAFT_529799 [Rhexocercosporidium sp. MPI-PUGE-AT-0058]
MDPPLLKRKTSSSSVGRRSEASDGSVREGKNPAAKSRLYEKTLQATGIYIGGGPGITDASRALCKSLLEAEQPLPPDSLFRDDRFEGTCERLCNENEAKVVRDITPLLVPSVEVLLGLVPQPDYSARCKETIFTKDQLRKLEPFITGWKGLNITDRQNAHSSGVTAVRIYGYHPVINGDQTSVYRFSLKKFDITNEKGINKWATYIFTTNVYDIYGPIHFERLCSAVDQLPDPLSDQHQPQ